MLGYLSAAAALESGFSHHGRYYGIPVWIGGLDAGDGGLLVAAKWAPMEGLMTLTHYIEQFLAGLVYPDEEPVFQFQVGAPIQRVHQP